METNKMICLFSYNALSVTRPNTLRFKWLLESLVLKCEINVPVVCIHLVYYNFDRLYVLLCHWVVLNKLSAGCIVIDAG